MRSTSRAELIAGALGDTKRDDHGLGWRRRRRGYWAHVDYDEPGPFSFLQGPGPVTAEEAVAWPRTHAKRVIFREGDRHYSAGEEPLRRFPLGSRSVADETHFPRPRGGTAATMAR